MDILTGKQNSIMKANELKVTDLMVGDWVICYHPTRLKSFEKVSVGLLQTMQEQEYGHIKENSPLFRIVEPIPLTPEILEKNGFKDLCYNYHHEYIGIDDRVVLSNYKEDIITNNGWHVQVDSEDFHTIAICEITYVHELQHALKLYEIDKEIDM